MKDSEWTLVSKPRSAHPPASKKAGTGNKGMASPRVCRGGDDDNEEVGGDEKGQEEKHKEKHKEGPEEGHNGIQMSITR